MNEQNPTLSLRAVALALGLERRVYLRLWRKLRRERQSKAQARLRYRLTLEDIERLLQEL